MPTGDDFVKLPKLKPLTLPRLPRGRIARGVATALFFAAVALAPTLLTSPDRLAPAIEGAFGSALEGPLDRSPDPSAKAAAEAAARRANPAAAGGPFAIAQADADRATWSWTEAKKLAAEVWEAQIPGPGVYSSFYCGCTVERRGATGGDVDTASCGYEMRSSALRASATTSRSGSSLNNSRRPRRTTAWSSTRRTSMARPTSLLGSERR